MNNLKRLLLIVPLVVLGFAAKGQLYGNEWIDYNKTYYKFKTSKEGVYRIKQSALNAAGIPSSVNGSNFILYRDGQEVPFFVTTTGSFGGNDYIEFFAGSAHGKLDKELYENPAFHPNDRINMFSDTACYFLTYDNSSAHARFVNVPNNIPSSPPTPQSFSMVTQGLYFKNTFSHGKHIENKQQIFSSVFDNAEGFVDTKFNGWTASNYTLNTPNVINAANAVINISVLRTTYEWDAMNMKVNLNNQLIADSLIKKDETKTFFLNVPSSLLSSSNNFQFVPTTPGTTYDEYGISLIEVKYPRDFDVTGMSYFRFQLPASASQYLEFSGFNHGGNAPRLYDLTSKKWYSGDISVSGKTRFFLDPSFSDRELLLYAAGSSNITDVSASKTINFVNYTPSSSNQGDYIILTHKNLSAMTNGHNYIQEYRDYRSSAAGGNRSVVVADVDELYDQFAYGIDMHPLSIRNFLKHAYDKWNTKPHDVFLVGKGIFYHKYKAYRQSPGTYNYSGIVPTYGEPGADLNFVNFLPNKIQAINIARLNAWNPSEIGIYLDKVKAFEAAVSTPAFPTHESELWKKSALHAAGGTTAVEQLGFVNTLNNGAALLKDAHFGGVVALAKKNTTPVISVDVDKTVDSLINSGLSFIAYHGHSSPNGFQFNLNNAESYKNLPRLPHFIALGCDVAQIFNLGSIKTISERYLVAPNGGSVSMIASDNLQYAWFHSIYLPSLYSSVSQRNYGKTIGDHHHYAYDSIRGIQNSESYFFHLESMLLQGDPAAKVYGTQKPDYHVASNRLYSNPPNVTSSLDSFTLNIVAFNLAKAVNNTVNLKVEHINPANATKTVKILQLDNLYYADTLSVNVPVNKVADIGLNRYKVTIDFDDQHDEMSEANNSATLDLFIYSDNLVPVYPKEFAIVNHQGVTLKASTLNPFRGVGSYKLEIDTTEQFNSPLKQQTSITSRGGVIKWTPGISYNDGVVYYWRTAFDSAVNGNYQWTNSSFIYLSAGTPGWNQSHYYQYLKNNFDGVTYEADRKFKYFSGYNKVRASNAIFDGTGQVTPWTTADFVKVMFNGSDIQRLGCWPWDGTLQVTVFDSMTSFPWKNDSLYGTSGAYPSCWDGTRNLYTFEFPINTLQGRNDVAHFLDSIPNGNYVLIRNIINLGKYDTAFIDEWKTDLPQSTSLYQTIQNLGFTQIDSFNQIRPFIFFRKKGDNNYPVYQYMGNSIQDTFVKEFIMPTYRHSGEMFSTVIGPAREWQQLKWKYSALDNLIQNDKPMVKIAGIDTNNNSLLLYEGIAQDTSLGFIDAKQYPNIRVTWFSLDTVNRTSPQLDYWRVLYSPMPEAALNPAAHFVFTDSVHVGQPVKLSVAIENLTDIPMDSMLVRYKVIDANNVTHTIGEPRYKKLSGNDTLHAEFSFDPAAYKGRNIFFVEANPDKDQPEQYHPNNLGYLPFRVMTDQSNPLIDVTFDGIHILDRDIVSSRPLIKITLRDENKYLVLDDTSLLTVKLRYPGDINTTREVHFDGTICKFIPAKGGTKNEAVIEYRPVFDQDGVYELIVNGTDRSGNEAGKTDYQISFEVINKSSITNILNYPNPFSTSTAFLFTLTGSQIPSQFKIQILTVTGKVVREITRQELGHIHIGRNITDYKWDGRDQYGQMLGNGVYLYRVVTSIGGTNIEHRQSGHDKFYKNGYGKMYIMR